MCMIQHFVEFSLGKNLVCPLLEREVDILEVKTVGEYSTARLQGEIATNTQNLLFHRTRWAAQMNIWV